MWQGAPVTHENFQPFFSGPHNSIKKKSCPWPTLYSTSKNTGNYTTQLYREIINDIRIPIKQPVWLMESVSGRFLFVAWKKPSMSCFCLGCLGENQCFWPGFACDGVWSWWWNQGIWYKNPTNKKEDITLPKTNIFASEHRVSQKERIVFQPSTFRCYVCFREGTTPKINMVSPKMMVWNMYSPENHQTSPEIPYWNSPLVFVFAGCSLLSTMTIFGINLC